MSKFIFIAGPCSVESEEQIISIAQELKKIGVDYPPSLLFVLCIIFLLFINFRNSRRIAELQMKVVELGQELAIVKEKVNRDEK